MGWLRAAVGVALVVAPGPFLRLSGGEEPTGAAVLLLRTIGIRDLVLGLGTVAAAGSGEVRDSRRWASVTCASDSLDVVASIASMRSIGKANSVAAAAVALLAVAGDVQALSSLRAATEHATRQPGAGRPSIR
jgi:hypothetical protein